MCDNITCASTLFVPYIHPRYAPRLAQLNKQWRSLLQNDAIWEQWLRKLVRDKKILYNFLTFKEKQILYNSYKAVVTTYIIKKRIKHFVYEATNDYLHGKYIFQTARTLGLSCLHDKSYFFDIFLGGPECEGTEIGVFLKLNGATILSFKYLSCGLFSSSKQTVTLIDNPAWSQYDIVRCKIDTKNHQVMFLKNGQHVCEPIQYLLLLNNPHTFKTRKSKFECSFTLRWARSGIKILQCSTC